MFQTKFLEKIKTRILYSISFIGKSFRLWVDVENYGRARQATYDNVIRRMGIACFITKATNTHSQCSTCCFSAAIGVTRTPPNVILTLPVLFYFAYERMAVLFPSEDSKCCLSASFVVSVQCHCRSMSKGSVVFVVVVAVAVLSTCSNFYAFYSSQQVVGGHCFFRRYRSGCCKWSALAASLVQWPRGDLIMPVKTLVRCAPILLDGTVPRVFGFVAGVYGHAPRFDISFSLICLWPTCAGSHKLDTCTKCLPSIYFEM
jgi:hypothetical protein